MRMRDFRQHHKGEVNRVKLENSIIEAVEEGNEALTKVLLSRYTRRYDVTKFLNAVVEVKEFVYRLRDLNQ